MQRYFASLTIVLVLGMVWVRVLVMRKEGIQAMKFGEIDKKDFLIPPFALFYLYVVLAAAFRLPTLSKQEFFRSEFASWIGVLFCLAGLLLLFLSLVSFGKKFPSWHRPGSPRQTGDNRHFCFQQKSHLRGLLVCLVRRIPSVPELDSPRVSADRQLAHPPSGAA